MPFNLKEVSFSFYQQNFGNKFIIFLPFISNLSSILSRAQCKGTDKLEEILILRGNLIDTDDSWFSGDVFPSVFGNRKDPFDDPFFTRPFGSLFRSSTFNSQPKRPVIIEVDSDEEAKLEENNITEANWRNSNPSVEHPEDQVNDHANSGSNEREISYSTNHDKSEKNQQQTRSVSYQRVTYGGIGGAYYSATTSRRTGNNEVMVEESRKADRTTGQATHRVSRGLHDKGHSVTRKLGSDGKVDTVQTLHNLNEDELGGFEQAWRSNGLLHDWDDAFDFPGNSGSRRQHGGLSSWAGHNDDPYPSRERPKKSLASQLPSPHQLEY